MDEIIRKDLHVQFRDWDCYPVITKYSNNNRLALMLYEHGTHEPIATASVNITDTDLADDCIFIKDYSENTGMTKALVEAEIVHEYCKIEIGPFNSMVSMCKLLIS